MAWKSIAPQPVRALLEGETRELNADRWDDFSGAIGCAGPDEAPRLTILAGEYTPLNESAFEEACASGTRI